jgi:hypothetical protein
LKTHFTQVYEHIQSIPNRRDILEGRIAFLESHDCSDGIHSCSSPVSSGVVSSLPCVHPDGSLIGLSIPVNETVIVSEHGSSPPPHVLIGLKNDPMKPEHGEKGVSRVNHAPTESDAMKDTTLIGEIDERTTQILALLNKPPRHVTHTQYGFVHAESYETPEQRLPDGSLNLNNPEAFAYVLRSSFLPIQDYPVSFFRPARWDGEKLEVRPVASAQLQLDRFRDVSKSDGKQCKKFIQKEFWYNVCATPMSTVIAMIKGDEFLKAHTALLRERFRAEPSEYSGDWGEATAWKQKILFEMTDADAKTITKEKRRFRELAETLPDNIKRHLPSITPSGWGIVYEEWGKKYFDPFCRKIVKHKMLLNGLFCCDIDGLVGDRLQEAKTTLINSGLCSLVATSARGNGLYAFIRFDRNIYRGSVGFDEARERIWAILHQMGLPPDTVCKDVNRRRFLAHDLELWLDESDTARLPEYKPVLKYKPNFQFGTPRG